MWLRYSIDLRLVGVILDQPWCSPGLLFELVPGIGMYRLHLLTLKFEVAIPRPPFLSRNLFLLSGLAHWKRFRRVHSARAALYMFK